MKTLYESPATRVVEVKTSGNMMLLNSNGKAPQMTPDLEEQDFSTIWDN